MVSGRSGHWCAAPNCRNNQRLNNNLSFFKFPKDCARAKAWTISCRREDLLNKTSEYLYKNCYICGTHFEDCMFSNFQKNRLKVDAIPTLFKIPNPPPFNACKRKLPADRSVARTLKKRKCKDRLTTNNKVVVRRVDQNQKECGDAYAKDKNCDNIEENLENHDILNNQRLRNHDLNEDSLKTTRSSSKRQTHNSMKASLPSTGMNTPKASNSQSFNDKEADEKVYHDHHYDLNRNDLIKKILELEDEYSNLKRKYQRYQIEMTQIVDELVNKKLSKS